MESPLHYPYKPARTRQPAAGFRGADALSKYEASIERKMRQATNSQPDQQTIHLFGQFCVRQPGRAITRFRTKKAAELLAYLAYYRHRQHAREALIELLWPEESLEAARNRLSVELNSLRRQLEPP